MAEVDIEGSNDILGVAEKAVVFHLVYFVADIEPPFQNEVHFKAFIKFVVYLLASVELSWLKVVEEREHEVLILQVMEIEERVPLEPLNRYLLLGQAFVRVITTDYEFARILEPKEPPEVMQEVMVQKGSEYAYLDFDW